MIYWLLAREVNVLRGKHSRDEDWDVVVDLFYYKKADEVNKFYKCRLLKKMGKKMKNKYKTPMDKINLENGTKLLKKKSKIMKKPGNDLIFISIYCFPLKPT
jgi:hypothetical protein